MIQISRITPAVASIIEMNDSLYTDSMYFEVERQNPPKSNFKSDISTSPTDFSASMKNMRGIYCTTVFTTTIAITDKRQQPKDIQNLKLENSTLSYTNGCCLI